MSEDERRPVQSFAFADYVLDADLIELRGPAGRIEVQRKVLQLLFFLAQHADRVVTKDEILAAVWPGTVVSDSVLSQAIRKARGAIGDDGAAQEFIRTVHGHGYRLGVDVQIIAEGAALPGRDARGDARTRASLAPAFDPLEVTDVPLAEDGIRDVPEFSPLPETPPRRNHRAIYLLGVASVALGAVVAGLLLLFG